MGDVKTPKKIYVEWKDATAKGGWHDPKAEELILIRTLGWLTNEDDEKITVSASIDPDNWAVSSNTIPKAWIVKRKFVRVKL